MSGGFTTRVTPAQGSKLDRLDKLNRYRENHNPVRGLNIRKAAHLVETYTRGEFADLMWTFGAPFMGIEAADADLLAIIGRRVDSLLEMDWNAKPETGDKVDTVLAAEQAAFVHDLVGNITNLYEAIEHMEMAAFRGFSHCEKERDASGSIRGLLPVDQWNIVRDGIAGQWKYNPSAQQTGFSSLPDDMLIEPEHFLIREVKRPVGRVALVKFIRQNMAEKDWDAFIELYGTDSGVAIMPPDVPAEKVSEYTAAAKSIAEGGSGALPHGSEYKPNPATNGRGASVFADHLKYLSERLVLAGTAGKLTMLAESGSGTLAGGAHAETFAQLARGEARRISEDIQCQVIAPELVAAFPGRPVCASFELAFREEVESEQVIKDSVTLQGAGWRMDTAELSEKTGYKLSDADSDPKKESDPLARPRKPLARPSRGKKAAITPEQLQNRSESISGGNLKNTKETNKGDSKSAISDLFEELFGEVAKDGFETWENTLANALAEGVENEVKDPIQNVGNSEGAKKGWETRRKNGWSAQKFKEAEAAEGDLKEFYAGAIDEAGGEPHRKLKWSAVDSAEAEALKESTGIDGLEGYSHSLDNFAARHIAKSHGNPEAELPRGQIAVTAEDIGKLPQHIALADKIEHAGPTRQKREAIRYYHEEEGTTTVVEEVRTGKKELVPVSIQKFKGKILKKQGDEDMN